MAWWDENERLIWIVGLAVALVVALVAYGAQQANQPVINEPGVGGAALR